MDFFRSQLIAMLFLACSPLCLRASAFDATVTRVIDGDTIVVETDDGTAETIRFWGIDAPELNQPHGVNARNTLERLVLGRRVELRHNNRRSWGRLVAEVYSGGTFINLALTRQGLARVDQRYTRYPPLLRAEETAKRCRRGMWR